MEAVPTPTTRSQAVAAGELHFDLHGEKLRGRFVLVRRGATRAARSSGCCSTSTTSTPSTGWDPEDHPRSVQDAAAPTTRCKRQRRRRRGAAMHRPRSWHRLSSTRDELAALDALGKRRATGSSTAHTLHAHQPRQGAVPRRTTATTPLTKRDLIRYYATIAPGDAARTSPTGRSTCTASPTASTSPASGTRRRRRTRPSGSTRGATTTPTRARPRSTSSLDRPPRWRGWRTSAPSSCTRGRRRIRRSAPADVGADRHRPRRRRRTFDDVARRSPGCTAPRSTTSACAAARRSPASAASRSGSRSAAGYTFDETRAWVERLSRVVGATVPELVSWEWEKREARRARPASTTPRTRSTRRSSRRSARAPAPGAPVSVPITWDELDDPELRPDRWTIRDVGARLLEVGDLFAEVLTTPQVLPPL